MGDFRTVVSTLAMGAALHAVSGEAAADPTLPPASPTGSSASPPAPPPPPAAPLPELEVRASGFRHDRGHAIATLFRPGDDLFAMKKKLFPRVKAVIREGKAIFRFPGLSDGDYAVIVFHDENDNDDLDHNVLGFPAEPMGFSSGFSPGLFSGLPTFEKLRFKLDRARNPASAIVTVHIK